MIRNPSLMRLTKLTFFRARAKHILLLSDQRVTGGLTPLYVARTVGNKKKKYVRRMGFKARKRNTLVSRQDRDGCSSKHVASVPPSSHAVDARPGSGAELQIKGLIPRAGK
ncbi:hypothetical protein PoB_005458400 [Plakobranchus ocellatus]|uniref:Uncharacterized protein n=1 Tax=Plakobranchus ocellatus TaxID=259542 RepID=A0AAV4CBK7_9GAST|nr:hypothetical protein PoB_005458400 [Plakobranchus ocellatus]